MPAPMLHLEVLSAAPERAALGGLTLNPRITAVSVTADTASGFNRCKIGYAAQRADGVTVAAYLPDPVEVADGAVIRLTDGAAVLFEGVVVAANDGSIDAEGFGLWAPRWGWINPGGAERVSMGTIVGTGFETCPWLRLVELTDTGVQHAWSELQNRSLGDAINQMLSEGGSVNGAQAAWMLLVYEDGLARLVPKLPAPSPDWILSYDPLTMDVSWQYGIVDAVRVAYTDGGVQRVTPWQYRGGVDQRSRYLRRETLTGNASTDGALSVAQTFLAAHSEKQIAATVTLADWDGLNYRPGQTVEMLGYGLALITGASHDLFTGTTQLQIGEQSAASWQGFVRQLGRAVRAIERGRNYTTGATT